MTRISREKYESDVWLLAKYSGMKSKICGIARSGRKEGVSNVDGTRKSQKKVTRSDSARNTEEECHAAGREAGTAEHGQEEKVHGK